MTEWFKYDLKDYKIKDMLLLHDYFFVVWKDDRYDDLCDMGLLSWSTNGFHRPEHAGSKVKERYIADSVLCFTPVKFPKFIPKKFLEFDKPNLAATKEN